MIVSTAAAGDVAPSPKVRATKAPAAACLLFFTRVSPVHDPISPLRSMASTATASIAFRPSAIRV
jgi:hypothetical protein